ncbi:uncharacterized protein FPRO_05381 [Fusarium proliferatum ET1]|uniref:Uncharacterized protein n=1 Tax=Fusarium proliferatum (strain ET1) TaxID=1227346 RepID=A0A1L7VIR5_FUSPR|nr:uncharacterized protein FPRO_05381 [Fusarium proliferatum ET1]CZR40481.1 uncharacterized protein FPRO_05381 [Fusarium proliferatum ET1]
MSDYLDVHKQQHFFSVEKNPEELPFLNAMLTIFNRLGHLDVVNHAYNYPHLHLAAFYGWYDVTEALLNWGSNPDAQNSKGFTALHVACASVEVKSTKIVQALMEKGADPNLKADATEFAPIHHLIWASCNAAEPWDCYGKIETLLNGGADINSRDIRGRTPIHLASCIPWCNSIFDHLYKRGARLDLRDNLRRSILHYAALYGDLDHITYLRKHGLTEPDPDGKDLNNRTPLDLMVWRTHAKQEDLWANMKRPTDEEVKAFTSLIEEIRTHRWQDGRSCWRGGEHANHLNPRHRLVNLPIRPKPNLTTPPSMEQEMHIKEQRADYA